MSTVKELIYYCKEEHPIGALLLAGEWGCGKTYVIEKDLTDALADTHIIVRCSLFGVNSIDILHRAVKNAWLNACMPVIGKIHDEISNEKQSLSVLTPFLKMINPVAAASVHILPEIEDPLHGTKKVILVFDDLERSKLDLVELLGAINEYCENKHFNTIIVTNENTSIHSMKDSDISYNILKEKIIARTIFNDPDYPAIIHSIVHNRKWPSMDYAAFLAKNENLILELFHSETPKRSGQKKSIRKYHNIRSLRCSLQEFYRLYEILTERESPEILPYLYSFIVYLIVSRNGIERDGKPSIDSTEEEIKQLYPDYRPDLLTDDIRQWIDEGIWEKESILRHISGQRNTAAET